MSSKTKSKEKELRSLAHLRKKKRLNGYDCIGDFHNRAFECDYVSPITKSGGNVNADVMIVLQDWASSDWLKNPEALKEVKEGCDRSSATNKNLDYCLRHHFRLDRSDCYLTNLFPFVKRGAMNAKIGNKDLICCARTFTRLEIEIVSPKLVICLGNLTFNALQSATDQNRVYLKLREAINSPFTIGESHVHCVAHTGGNRTLKRKEKEKVWKNLADLHRKKNSYQTQFIKQKRH